MKLADKIRDFVYKEYIEPARKKGLEKITIRAGDVHDKMGLKNRIPAVIEALGSRLFENKYGIKRIAINGSINSANANFTFEILKPHV